MDVKETYAVYVVGSVEGRFAVLSQVAEWRMVGYVGESPVCPGEDVYVVGVRVLNDFRRIVGWCGCSVSFFKRNEG
jgi:hypothetical protein